VPRSKPPVADAAQGYRPVYLRVLTLTLVLLLLLIGLALLSVGVGSVAIPPGETARIVWARLVGGASPADPIHVGIIWNLRLPRIALGALVGAALSLAGVATQGLLLNPLADPYILGVSSGAALGAAVGIMTGWEGALYGLGLPAAAFAGALATLALVMTLARAGGRIASHNFLLAGVVVGSFLWALITLALSVAGADLQRLIFWLMGTLSAKQWVHVALLAPLTLVGAAVLWLMARDLNLLALGDTAAQQLGVAVEQTKLIVILAAALLTAGAVSMSGIIGFVGLVVPHMMRRIVGPDHRLLLPAAALAGAGFLIAADTIVRGVLVRSTLGELPVGVVTALAGAPVFCYLLRRGRQMEG
jgi:iron complex transport system permease protein